MSIRCLFSPTGRVGRSSYWGVVVGTSIVLFALSLINSGTDARWGSVLSGIAGIVSLVIAIVTQIKRWHDRNKSGSWVLLNFIPVVGWIWTFVELGFLAGSDGANGYGLPEGGSPFLP